MQNQLMGLGQTLFGAWCWTRQHHWSCVFASKKKIGRKPYLVYILLQQVEHKPKREFKISCWLFTTNQRQQDGRFLQTEAEIQMLQELISLPVATNLCARDCHYSDRGLHSFTLIQTSYMLVIISHELILFRLLLFSLFMSICLLHWSVYQPQRILFPVPLSTSKHHGSKGTSAISTETVLFKVLVTSMPNSFLSLRGLNSIPKMMLRRPTLVNLGYTQSLFHHNLIQSGALR